jgi:hypothetical protein
MTALRSTDLAAQVAQRLPHKGSGGGGVKGVHLARRVPRAHGRQLGPSLLLYRELHAWRYAKCSNGWACGVWDVRVCVTRDEVRVDACRYQAFPVSMCEHEVI